MNPLRGLVFFVLALVLISASSASAERVMRGALITENIPEPSAKVLESIKRYQNTRQYYFQGWMHAGLLVITRIDRTRQAYLFKKPKKTRRHKTQFRNGSRHRSLAEKGMPVKPMRNDPSSPVQLTHFREPARNITPSPDGRHFIASRDAGGNEQYQGRLFSDGQPGSIAFTDQKYRNTGFVFSGDGQWIAWQRTSGDSPNWDILLTPLDNPARGRRVVFKGEGVWLVQDISPDNRYLLLLKYISVSEGRLYLLDTQTGVVKDVNATPYPVAYGMGKFTRDGQFIIVLSDEGRDFISLLRIDVQDGTKAALNPEFRGDITGFTLSNNGKYLAYAVNIDGQSSLVLALAKNGRVMASPKMSPGVISGLAFDPSGRRLGFTFDGAQNPAGAWVYNRRSRRLTQWTPSQREPDEPVGFHAARLIHYRSFTEADGRQRLIPAYVYKPKTRSGRLVPVIISIHGGPEAQYRPRFSPRFQYWVQELGAAVISPNVRGSTGYGGDYVTLDDGVLRQDAVRDIGALIDWIRTRKEFDASRIVVHGGSYGGYMVLASMTQYPEKLAGGVDIVGISNFVTFLENTKNYRQDLRRMEYGDERNPEIRAFLNAISPLNHADKIRAPLMIIQGKNDPRVPASESEQMLRAAQANGAPVWFMMAKDEGHGFLKRENVLAMWAAEDAFLRMIFFNESPS
jgi:dipeptidyl aminopeptidase/acylaminoacyl peptidase